MGKSFIIHCSAYSVKKSWMSTLSQIVKPAKSQQRELAAPLMVPDDWSDECQMKECDTKFSFVNRRHHCRYCGKLICGKCGKYKLASKGNKDKVVKPVCKKCFNAFHNILPAREMRPKKMRKVIKIRMILMRDHFRGDLFNF